MPVVLLVSAILLVVVACGSGDGSSVATGDDGALSGTPQASDGDRRYTATTVVLESPEHGAQLCLGVVAESYPPQCTGPDVVGWDWDLVAGEESASGTTWGTYTVVGTWDGDALTLTEPPAPPEPPDPSQQQRPGPSTPCAEPEGGWQVIDESRTSDEAMRAAIRYARSQPSVGGVWVDQSIGPASDREPVDESRMDDATEVILNVSFTEDLQRHEAAMRELWGGPLCVSEARISARHLAEIRAEVEAEVGDHLFSSIDEVHGQVQVGVPVDDGLQRRFDERYGVGVVDVEPQLRPVDG